jgi:hypothetical protein
VEVVVDKEAADRAVEDMVVEKEGSTKSQIL